MIVEEEELGRKVTGTTSNLGEKGAPVAQRKAMAPVTAAWRSRRFSSANCACHVIGVDVEQSLRQEACGECRFILFRNMTSIHTH